MTFEASSTETGNMWTSLFKLYYNAILTYIFLFIYYGVMCFQSRALTYTPTIEPTLGVTSLFQMSRDESGIH